MSDIFSDYLGQVKPEQITNELKTIGVSEEQKERMFQLFWRADSYNSIISYRTYLNHLKSFLHKNPNRAFSRPDFYKYLSEKLVDKDTLSKLAEIAASMELLETNFLTEGDFDQLLSELKMTRDQIKFEFLVKTEVLKIVPPTEQRAEKTIEFFHHTVQEYLAVIFISSFDDPFQKLLELCTINVEGKMSVKPSWYNVIRFILEANNQLKDSVLDWLLKLGKEDTENVVNELYSVAITSVDIDNISTTQRSTIFELIYNTYLHRLLWLPLWTRNPLAKFITDEQINGLKDSLADFKPSSDKERYLHLGFVAEIIGGLLELTPERVEKDRKFWLKNLTKWANDKNDNGVLQRNSLHALKFFKSEDERQNELLVESVKDAYDSGDELVQQVFLQFASEVAPNSKLTIDFIERGIVDEKVTIYGRHALYNVNSFDGITYFLHKLSSNTKFLYEFLDRESIFNSDGKYGDKAIIDIIKKYAPKLLIELKAIIYTAFDTEKFYHEEKSYFLSEILQIVYEFEKNYINEVLDYLIKIPEKNRKWTLFHDYSDFLALIAQEKDIDSFAEKTKRIYLEDGNVILEHFIYKIRQTRGTEGERLFKYAVSKNYIPEPPPPIQKDYEEERHDKLIKELRFKLEPEPKKYMPDVFEFYVRHKKELGDIGNEENRLKELLISSGFKINPREIKVTIPDKSVSSFNISSTASIYGDVLRAAQELLPDELINHRQDIIDFIPFAFSDDQVTILELVPDINDQELTFVNSVYEDKKNDARYLLPSSYIYLIEKYAKNGNILYSTIPVLISFLDDINIKIYDKRSTVEVLSLILSTQNIEYKKIFEKIFDKYIASDKPEEKKFAETANALLIDVFKDDRAIDWRFKQLLNNPQTYSPPPSMTVYTPDPFEEEFGQLTFARPLIKLKDLNFLKNNFFQLIDAGFALLKKPKTEQLESYGYYLFNVVFSAVREMGSDQSLTALLKYLSKFESDANINWWNQKLEELKQDLISKQKPNDISLVIKLKEERSKNGIN
jgi:hypothetical protein